MKKNPLIYAVLAATLLSGAVACDKQSTTAYDGEEGTGKVVVAFNFDESLTTRAYAASGRIPTTSWRDNIKSLSLYLVDASGVIKVAQPIVVPALTSHDVQTFTFSNVPAGNYTGYLVANYDQTANVAAGFSGTTKDLNISTLLMGLVATTDPVGGAAAYKPAGEIFLAQRANTNVTANTTNDFTTTPFSLKRAVSMLRVRINKDFQNNSTLGEVDNNDVQFGAKGSLRIRKAGTKLAWTGTVTPAAPAGTDMIYAPGMEEGNTSTSLFPYPYAATGNFVDTAGGQTAWRDVLLYPGGGVGVTGAPGAVNVGNKFNIVISGEAPAGYVPSGATVALTAPAAVYWSGTVESVIAANKILVLNVDLINQGSPVIPPVTENGELKIGVDLMEWETIPAVDLPM